MLKKTLGLLLVICLVAAGMSVHGEGAVTASISYLPENGEIIVLGEAEGRVVITVAPAELLPENMSGSALPTIFKQIEADGTYSCTIGMPYSAPGGKYKVYVSCPGGEATDSFVYMNVADAEQLIPLLNEADGNEFDELILDNALTLGIDMDDALFVKEQKDIFNLLNKMNFKDPADFYARFAKSYAICVIEGQEKTENVEAVLAKYYMQLGIDYTAEFLNESRLDKNGKTTLLDLLSEINYADKADVNGNINFAALFRENKALAAVKSAKSWVSVKNAITNDFANDFKDLLENDTYNKVKDKDKIFEEMMSGDRSSIKAIERNFIAAAESVYAAQKRSTSNTTTSGKGSTSSAVTTPAAPSATEAETKALFSDVPKEHWAYAAVNILADKGVISGYEDGLFCPSNQITRAEFTKLIMAFADTVEAEALEAEKIMFADVNDSDWFKEFVYSAAEYGIIMGSEGLFNPNNSITREDAALIIYRLMISIDKKPLGYKPFADRNDISDYAKEAVHALGGAHIVQGSGENMFLPKNNITRAEAAQLIYNALLK